MKTARAPRGWSLVELMLAIALGLLLMAGLLRLATGHIDEQRRLLLDTRLTQDLRTVIELVSRDLRRSAYWGAAADAVWDPARPGTRPANPYGGVVRGGTTNAAALGYSYSRDANEDGVNSNQEKFGLRLNTTTQVIEWRMSGSAVAPDDRDQWQALTDPALMKVTRLSITVDEARHSLAGLCPQSNCGTATGASCPPMLVQHMIRVDIEASDARDSRIQRQLSTRAKARNDEVTGACPA